MNWCMLLVMASVAGPWSQNTCRNYYWTQPMPVYVTSQEASNCVTYSPAMVCGQEIAQVCEESKSVAANASDKKEEKSTVAASATETDPAADENTTEFINYSSPASYGGGDMGLGWGVASIGAGTLYPNAQNLSGGGAFPFMRGLGGTTSTGSGGSSATVAPSPIVIYNIINNPASGGGGSSGGGGGGGGVSPVPEPTSLAAWAFGTLAVGIVVHRRKTRGKTASN